MKDNIFTYEGPRGELVETFYKLLMTRKLISYEDILIEYDGEDGEIQYTKGKGKNTPLIAMHHIKDKPNYYLNMIMAQRMMQRVYG